MTRRFALHTWTALPLAILVLAGCGDSRSTGDSDEPNAALGPTTTATASPTRTARASTREHAAAKPRNDRRSTSATAALDALPVKGRAPKTGYSRAQYGDGWQAVSGCRTRDRMLDRDLTSKRFLDECRVRSGELNDPYTAARITFQRGGANEVDVDHVVALSDAWQKGAQQWSQQSRVAFANDALNLLSVDAAANRAKGDGDAATWLPKNKRFRCKYVARQVAVKTNYHAWVTQAEHDAIARVLATCPGEPLPTTGSERERVVPTHTKAAPTPIATAGPAPRKSGSESDSEPGATYANCDAARAAGAAPITRGSADYDANPNLDRDDDGVACES